MSATCVKCQKQLNGKWSMESNPSNAQYLNCPNGRYLGINDGYFLYSGNPNWVYSYCKTCWINEIKITAPQLGIQIDSSNYPQGNIAKCTSCSKQLNGKWKMESNPSNATYHNNPNGRYLGITDGYFLYSGNANWVYCYCKTCWVKEITNLLPSLGLSNNLLTEENKKLSEEINKQNQKISELTTINENLRTENKKIFELTTQNENLNIEINKLEESLKKEIEEKKKEKNFDLNNFINFDAIKEVNKIIETLNYENKIDFNEFFRKEEFEIHIYNNVQIFCSDFLQEKVNENSSLVDFKLKEIEAKINTTRTYNDKLTQDLNQMDQPEEVIKQHVLIQNNYLDKLKNLSEKLVKLKSKIISILK